jgi:acetolactate synthase I/II/III large subunit
VASAKPAVIELRTDPEQITTRATIADLRAAADKPARPAKRAPVAPARPKPAAKR